MGVTLSDRSLPFLPILSSFHNLSEVQVRSCSKKTANNRERGIAELNFTFIYLFVNVTADRYLPPQTLTGGYCFQPVSLFVCLEDNPKVVVF